MPVSRGALEQLKSLTPIKLIKAIEKDGWTEESGRGAIRSYYKDHGNGGRKRIQVHYHPGRTYGRRLLKGLMEDTEWDDDDLVRLKLIKRKGSKRSS